MRWALHVGCAGLAAAAVMAPTSCSTNGAATDAGSDVFVSKPCSSNADCPTGTKCLYSVSAGCKASPHCLPSDGAACGTYACSCKGATIEACHGAASAPISYLGACESGCDNVSALLCECTDTAGYSPTPMAAPIVSPNACSPSEISGFVAACYGTGSTRQICDAWAAVETDAGPCLGCLISLRSASTWGTTVCASSRCSANFGGCVDLELGQVSQEKQAGGAGSCGDRVSDAYGCVDYACAGCSSTGGPLSDLAACMEDAKQNECKFYFDAAINGSLCAPLQGDAASTNVLRCFPKTDTDFQSFVNVFCGTGP